MASGWWIAGLVCVVGCGGRSSESRATPNEPTGPSTGGVGAGAANDAASGTTNGGLGNAMSGGAIAVGGTAGVAGTASIDTESAGASSDAGAGGASDGRCTPGAVQCLSFRERCDE